jgi:hypothetical protein
LFTDGIFSVALVTTRALAAGVRQGETDQELESTGYSTCLGKNPGLRQGDDLGREV